MEGKACTFFGHRECPATVKTMLRTVLEDLILRNGVDMFYVGNQGRFDAYARCVLQDLRKIYSHISYSVVLAYFPSRKNGYTDDADTMFPEGLELIHPRYAIHWRNRWLLQHSDYVVSFITHEWGGAAQYVKAARRHGTIVINIASDSEN